MITASVAAAPPRSRAGTVAALSGALVAIGLQAQTTVPLTAAGLHLSAADPFVAAIGAYLFWRAVKTGWAGSLRTLPPLAMWLLLPTLALTVSLATGIIRSGHVSGWALGSKYAGWFVLLGYFAAGAWVAATEARAARIACQSFVAFLALVSLVQVAPDYLADLALPVPASWIGIQISGLTENRNAFAFLLLVGQAIVYAHWHEGWLERRRLPLTVLLWAAMWYDASRTGLAVTVALAGAVLVLRIVPFRDFVACVLTAALVALLVPAVPAAFTAASYVAGLVHDAIARIGFQPPAGISALMTMPSPRATTYIPILTSSAEVSLQDRIDGYWLAWDLWRQHPVLGAGLGGFLDAHQTVFGYPQVIHGSLLWIGTEMGLVGLAAFVAFEWRLLREFGAPLIRGHASPMQTAALLTLSSYLLMSLAHELTYQRALWLLLGLTAHQSFLTTTARPGAM